MTSRERLMAAYRCEKPDRVPIFVRGVYPLVAPENNYLLKKGGNFKKLVEYVEQKCDLVHFIWFRTGFFMTAGGDYDVENEERDNKRVERVVYHTPKGGLTLEVTYARDQPNMVTKHWITCDEDVERFLSIPYEPPRPDMTRYLEMEKRIGGRGLATAEVSCAVSHVHSLFGSEELCIKSITHRNLIIDLVKLFNKRALDLIEYYLDSGFGPMLALSGQEYITPPLHSPQDFKDFIVPFDRELIRLIHDRGRLCRIHCHGNIGKLLGMFEETGVDALHPVECVPFGDTTLVEFRERLGNRIAIKGNMQIADLIDRTPEEIDAMVRQTIEEGGRNGALILAPSASPYLRELSDKALANYKAFIDAGLKYGKY